MFISTNRCSSFLATTNDDDENNDDQEKNETSTCSKEPDLKVQKFRKKKFRGVSLTFSTFTLFFITFSTKNKLPPPKVKKIFLNEEWSHKPVKKLNCIAPKAHQLAGLVIIENLSGSIHIAPNCFLIRKKIPLT
ncbi:hypothetical protein B9Z55_007977 [Caenorhabditis nigoni]|uniref:Uncharacterized protein n=1 Tax=Caenorhabditis nigoni TaxID=1611254 RepID=A0A2G5VC52_9PELO|nr:hypothetical protein B9Z55_007977 [Caenorhabditis nigoni]